MGVGVMPKERIDSADVESNWTALVAWGLGPFVQLGAEQVAGFSIVDTLYGQGPGSLLALGKAATKLFVLPVPGAQTSDAEDAAYVARGRAVLDLVTGSESSPSGSYTGLWVNLDRRGCNRLIEVIRRARDKAFGRDA